MTLDWTAEFPILQAWTYLANATFGPVPASHARAAAGVAARMSAERIGDIGASAALEELRADAASLLGCEPGSVALLKSTSEGVGLVAAGLDWQAGDEVIVYEREFPGTVAPWRNLQDRGVGVRVIADRGRARFDAADVAELITERTRVVCVSLVNSDHGFRAPVEEIAKLCRPAGIWLVVDAVQAVGVLDIAAASLGADIVAAHGYKFLLSGFGIALAYCSPRALTELRVPIMGWKNAPHPRSEFAVDRAASRFESTLPAVPIMIGMSESLRVLQDIGLPAIQDRALAIAGELADGLEARGYEVFSSRAAAERSALVTARHRAMNAVELHGRLTDAKIACAVRGGGVRFSPHFYNDSSDVQRVLEALPA